MLSRHIVIAYLFFFFAWIPDGYATTWGILRGYSEGNYVTLWLWSIFGWENPLLYIGYFIVVFFLSLFLFSKISKFLGILISFSFGAGHILGFLTWVPIIFPNFRLDFISQLNYLYGINGIFVLSPIIGAVLSFIYYILLIKTNE